MKGGDFEKERKEEGTNDLPAQTEKKRESIPGFEGCCLESS